MDDLSSMKPTTRGNGRQARGERRDDVQIAEGFADAMAATREPRRHVERIRGVRVLERQVKPEAR